MKKLTIMEYSILKGTSQGDVDISIMGAEHDAAQKLKAENYLTEDNSKRTAFNSGFTTYKITKKGEMCLKENEKMNV